MAASGASGGMQSLRVAAPLRAAGGEGQGGGGELARSGGGPEPRACSDESQGRGNDEKLPVPTQRADPNHSLATCASQAGLLDRARQLPAFFFLFSVLAKTLAASACLSLRLDRPRRRWMASSLSFSDWLFAVEKEHTRVLHLLDG